MRANLMIPRTRAHPLHETREIMMKAYKRADAISPALYAEEYFAGACDVTREREREMKCTYITLKCAAH